MNFSFDINYIKNYEVAVVGGGTAGVFAAISAARTGARTVLIEKNNILGGSMTVANVCFPGLFFAWGKRIIGGPCWESIERTVELGGAKIPEISFKPKRHWFEQISMNRFIYTHVLFEMCKEAGVDVICASMLSHVTETKDGVQLIITGKEGMSVINAKSAVDATGDANLCSMAGFKLMKSERQQPATLGNHISGYTLSDELLDEVRKEIPKATFPEYIEPHHLIHFLNINKIDLHIPCVDADTSIGKTALERRAYEDVQMICNFYRKIKGLENLYVDFVVQETGVRETNRVVGETVISADDYINGYHYDDSICYAFYPIDLHIMNGIEQKFHEENVVSRIPYRALIPKGSKRIFCAGRCISSDTYANSAIRVEAVCMATGQTSGIAASICAKENINAIDVDYSTLCSKMEEQGCIIPKKDN